MKKKVWIIPDDVVFYCRVGTEEQLDKDLLILTKQDAIDLCETIKNQLFISKKIPKLLKEGVDNNGIF